MNVDFFCRIASKKGIKKKNETGGLKKASIQDGDCSKKGVQ